MCRLSKERKADYRAYKSSIILWRIEFGGPDLLEEAKEGQLVAGPDAGGGGGGGKWSQR